MAQQMIVEGKDGIVLANLLDKRKLPFPQGYSSKRKFKNEFVKITDGIDNMESVLEIALKDTELTNMGIIVDANNAGVQHRWDRIKTILANSGKFEQHELDAHENVGGGKIITAENMTIGV